MPKHKCINQPHGERKMAILAYGKKQDDKNIKSIYVDFLGVWEHYQNGEKCRIFWRRRDHMWKWIRKMKAKGVVIEKGEMEQEEWA